MVVVRLKPGGISMWVCCYMEAKLRNITVYIFQKMFQPHRVKASSLYIYQVTDRFKAAKSKKCNVRYWNGIITIIIENEARKRTMKNTTEVQIELWLKLPTGGKGPPSCISQFGLIAYLAWGEEKKSHSGLAARLENRIAFYMRLSFLAAFNVIWLIWRIMKL